ncbi:hypothetical protein CEP54_014110 [Fusarium duplospermum]|uniref:Uncharacterized protein n=1 Tax=Fusarium duplospermum TaxID=1325734 RepID=A0A428NYN7_9HYPO|nr:hypothetical protein CEP54_014110 [Fusarium duplospermum]
MPRSRIGTGTIVPYHVEPDRTTNKYFRADLIRCGFSVNVWGFGVLEFILKLATKWAYAPSGCGVSSSKIDLTTVRQYVHSVH